ncbi:MAG: bifunctional oligoribonuclease/PAP phosphatase NrnA [Candidatus Doudnabacteria bacterium]|nr:bifunctional oligoribonuclease/PAP phosphatase NrnA [Candidatus Doudnabacteria bacterium]
MKENFDKARNLIDQSQRILLTMHERMDGDDGGSVLALAKHLESKGKNVTCAIRQGVPQALRFLPGSHKILDDITHEKFDLIIACGCSNRKRCGSEKIMSLGAPLINIDHHPDNENFGKINIVDPNKSSVAELVYDMFQHHKWPIDKDIATCLLTGIVTDTGSFMHSNTQNSTLMAAGELLKKGARLQSILENTYKNKTPKTLKAWGQALSNLHYDQNRKIIYSVIDQQDLASLGALPKNAFEGLAETLNTYPEAKFAMFLKQDGEVIKGSLRTNSLKNSDVSVLAKIFGGGGHRMAAGFSVAGKLEKDEQGKWRVI